MIAKGLAAALAFLVLGFGASSAQSASLRDRSALAVEFVARRGTPALAAIGIPEGDRLVAAQLRRGFRGGGFAMRGAGFRRGGFAVRGGAGVGRYGGGYAYRRGVVVGPRGGAVAYRGGVAVGPRGGVYRGGVVAVRNPVLVGGIYRPYGATWLPGGAIAAGAAVGFVTAATAVAWAGAPPRPGYCWYYTDASRTKGFWDVCPR